MPEVATNSAVSIRCRSMYGRRILQAVVGLLARTRQVLPVALGMLVPATALYRGTHGPLGMVGWQKDSLRDVVGQQRIPVPLDVGAEQTSRYAIDQLADGCRHRIDG
jgi:hypothetical protein